MNDDVVEVLERKAGESARRGGQVPEVEREADLAGLLSCAACTWGSLSRYDQMMELTISNDDTQVQTWEDTVAKAGKVPGQGGRWLSCIRQCTWTW